MSAIAKPRPRVYNATGHGPDKVYTTGQVARICQVAPRTAGKWIDSGALQGYRIPGSQDRRVPRANLLKFLEEHGIPRDRVEADGMTRVLFVGSPGPLAESVAGSLRDRDGWLVKAATGPFEAGLLATSFLPHALIADAASLGRIDCRVIAHGLRALPGGPDVALVLIGSAQDGLDLGYDCALGMAAGLPLMIREILADRRSRATA